MPKRRSSRLPLLRYPGAAAAYSTRLLNTAYTGAALRVRRSNDNAEQDIGFANGNLDEAALTAFVGANSAFVTTWYDQSGNARNATQTTAANQPRIVNAGVVDKRNGRVGPWFDNQTNGYQFSIANPIAATQVFTGFCTGYNGPTTGANGVPNNPFIGGNDGSAGLRFEAGGFATLTRTNQADIIVGSANSVPPAKVNQATFLQNNAASAIYANGVLAGTGGAGAYTQAFSRIGVIGSNNVQVFEDVMHEVILYASDQSANRAAIESNIMSYFGITA